jgi:glycosyltransferase involved in cell wall biosynthesis
MLKDIPIDEYVVFAAREELPLGPDGPNCVRSWGVSKFVNGLEAILPELKARDVGALIIEFNYGFFSHAELDGFIQSVASTGVAVLMHLHSTADPYPSPEYKLDGFVEGLRRCSRILVHSPADMNRLKAIGLIDNVMLLPLGVVSRSVAATPVPALAETPLIASFGFCLPNKGLVELVSAVAILRDMGVRVRLRMLNAQHPASWSGSAEMADAIRASIVSWGLEEDVELRTEFLDDELCLQLLSEADLIVNPYQNTGESASAAVRYALAAARPVVVTPLPIFDDLGTAVYRLPGVAPLDLARGISAVLLDIQSDSPKASLVRETASQWVRMHDIRRKGIRMMRLARSFASGMSELRDLRQAVDE